MRPTIQRLFTIILVLRKIATYQWAWIGRMLTGVVTCRRSRGVERYQRRYGSLHRASEGGDSYPGKFARSKHRRAALCGDWTILWHAKDRRGASTQAPS